MSLCRVLQNSCRFTGINLCKSFGAPSNLFFTNTQRLKPFLKIPKINETVHFSISELLQPLGIRCIYSSSTVFSIKKTDVKEVKKAVEAEVEKDEKVSKQDSLLWLMERIMSLILLIGIPTAFVSPSKELDIALGIAVVMHSHWGLDSIAIDYVHDETLGKVLKVALFIISILTLSGLLFFNFNDIGVTNAIKKFWKLVPPKEEPIVDVKKR